MPKCSRYKVCFVITAAFVHEPTDQSTAAVSPSVRLQAELDDKLRGSEDLVWLRSWPSSFFGKMGHGYGHLIKSLHTLPPWMPARPASRSLIRTRNLSSFASQPWPTLHASLSTAMRAVGGQPMSDLKEWLLATVQLHNCIA